MTYYISSLVLPVLSDVMANVLGGRLDRTMSARGVWKAALVHPNIHIFCLEVVE